jgi:hypothetical protein
MRQVKSTVGSRHLSPQKRSTSATLTCAPGQAQNHSNRSNASDRRPPGARENRPLLSTLAVTGEKRDCTSIAARHTSPWTKSTCHQNTMYQRRIEYLDRNARLKTLENRVRRLSSTVQTHRRQAQSGHTVSRPACILHASMGLRRHLRMMRPIDSASNYV